MPTATLNPIGSTTTELDRNTPVYPAPAGARTSGISLYDYLATVALQGLLSHGLELKADRVLTEDEKDDEMARRAYKLASAMLRARAAATSGKR